MSMTEIIDDMTQEMTGSDGFERFMNEPLPHNGQAYIQRDYKTGISWVCCPYCGRKNLQITEKTKINNLSYPCKNTKCKKIFEVNID